MSTLAPGFEIGGFVLEKNVGSGAFASVWRAHHKITEHVVAIKVIAKAGITTQVALTRLRREIAFLEKMEHPFVAEFFQVIENDADYFLVMEYAENGNLLDYVNTNGRLAEDQARRYFAQLISVLEYLHLERKVAHRDLKCENVLLDRYNNIRVIDFGLSNQFSDVNPKLSTACGSPAYAAPEMVKGNTYTQAADIWSAGILLFAIVAGHLPFDDDNIQRLLQKIVYTEVRYPAFMTPQLVDLLQKMICKDPGRRINLDMIKNHPWFSQTEYLALLEQSKIEANWDSQSCDTVSQKEIIDQITAYGIDCHGLHQALLTREFTELTALYRIIFREKTTEKMKDLMQKVCQQSAPGRKVPVPLGRPVVPGGPARAAVPGSSGRPSPFPVGGAGPGPRVLTTPVVANTSARRGSRPVAVRPNVAMPTPRGGATGAHEA
jgi:serine/threonine protein kinase